MIETNHTHDLHRLLHFRPLGLEEEKNDLEPNCFWIGMERTRLRTDYYYVTNLKACERNKRKQRPVLSNHAYFFDLV